MRIPDWKAMGRMTDGEYRANLNGLGIFFGAVLGFVMAGTEALAPRDFAMTLFLSATAVICILYVSSSSKRLLYAAITILYIAMLPTILHELLSKGAAIPRNLQPTLAVWLAITLLVEFMPRDRDRMPAGTGQANASPPRSPAGRSRTPAGNIPRPARVRRRRIC